ncbi:hypothetical protein Cme02nite_28570 [Catellatospora methionotrophica]|uniref:Uncharacterized protein n=1 Tax=Catellatospora methionotrophica TaxID=121620 RepID=A0A8J3L950_9ACTN|nr:hypothetical protein [Catellatospora methionotrophica]GIG14525.1 hypothetical protein Cme02nite_28570 [Catellatospora methionotrophica]
MDDLIRAALLDMAKHSPDAATVRAGTNARMRQLRQRRAVLAVAGVAAVASATPLVVRDRPQAGPTSGSLLPPAFPDLPVGPGNVGVAIRHHPTWLPDGFVESARQAVLSAQPTYTAREWSAPGDHPESTVAPRISVSHQSAASPWHPRRSDRQGKKVTVNGADGLAWSDGDDVELEWPSADGGFLRVSLHAVRPGLATARRIAESVVADDVTIMECALAFGWLPPDLVGSAILARSTTDGSGRPSVSAWNQELMLTGGRLWIMCGTATDQWELDSRGRAATVRGLPGRVNPDGDELWVRLPDGRHLLASTQRGAVPFARLVKVMEHIRLGPLPNVAWIGSR